MERIVRTVYGSYLQTSSLLGLPFVLKDNTTLNEKFNIQAKVQPGPTEFPKLKYFTVGNGGHRYITGTGGIPITEPIQHRATDAALFNHLPMVLRKPELDLSPAQRANYALRRQETHNGESYYAYYLRRINMDSVVNEMEYRNVRNGSTVVSPFIPDSSNLNPTPPDLNVSGVNTTTGAYVSVTAKLQLSLSDTDIEELLHVAEVIYQDDSYAIISEIGLCTGVDKVVNVMGSSGQFNFNEAIAVQIASFFSVHSALKFFSTGMTIILDVGSTEPLYQLGEVT